MGLSLRGVSFAYPGAAPVLRELELELEDEAVLVVAGPSGAGKSTLARLAVGLLAPQRGEVLLDGVPPRIGPGRPAPAQLVFQDASSAFNARLPLRHALAETGAGEDRQREMLALLGLDPALLARRPARLSGGERQRFGLARALLADPRVLVADEPVAQLDPLAALQVVEALDRARRASGCALLVMSHRPAWMRRLGGRQLELRGGRLRAPR